MEKLTMKTFYTQYMREEKALTRQLRFLHSSKQTVASEHDRAQSAFMKRYSALLKRKKGGLLPARGKTSASTNKAGLHVTGAGVGKPSKHQGMMNFTEFDPLITMGEVGGAKDSLKIQSKNGPNNARSCEKATQRVRNWSAPVCRDRTTTVLPSIEGCPTQYLTDIVSFNNQLGRHRRQHVIGQCRKIRNAWEQDDESNETSAQELTDGLILKDIDKDPFSRQSTQTCRGILMNGAPHHSKLTSDLTSAESGPVRVSRRRTMSSDPHVSFENCCARESFGTFKDGSKKKVTFAEEQRHEADNSSFTHGDQFSTRRQINIVNL